MSRPAVFLRIFDIYQFVAERQKENIYFVRGGGGGGQAFHFGKNDFE